MKNFLLALICITITSCIPYKIAPKFKNEDYKVIKAKKFQRKLPRETSFIFKDPKNADEFYHYINKKYNLNHKDVGLNTPFKIEGKSFYLSYREVERTDEKLILPLALIDLRRSSNGNDPLFEGNYSTRKGHWYLILTVYDEDIKNCLIGKHPMKAKVLQYLKDLKQEYLTTQNYEELLLTKKS
ncbi:hypothetical protein H8K90_08765 [Winogradskyella echinorum]|uniref:Lipoprotein n=1 Tax=Winogradskyella echinorum TaxID=538189 RepID=A0ABR6Y1E2_9FLAO|nr:hypothetical protein [Winogradskyella echinorum]MBC3846469.1 hypothetical protein [Winogradskyella echinorum]MBC5750817.1 hypothetical protein [Winogradskyella echinorum]